MFSNIEEMKKRGNVEWLFAFLHDYKEESEKGWMARLDAAEALAELGDPRGFDYLREMADSPNQDIREVALEILDGLKDHPVDSLKPVERSVQPGSESLFFKVNAKYPYEVAWAAFLVLFTVMIILLNGLANDFLLLTQPWLPAWIASLVLFLLPVILGFLAFRYVIKLFVLPYVKNA